MGDFRTEAPQVGFGPVDWLRSSYPAAFGSPAEEADALDQRPTYHGRQGGRDECKPCSKAMP